MASSKKLQAATKRRAKGQLAKCAERARAYMAARRAADPTLGARTNTEQRRRRRAYVTAQKARPCLDCGGSFPSYVMHFDHVRGTKRANVSRMVDTCSLRLIKEEIAKCDLVCANCHAIRTWGEKKEQVA